VSWKNAIFRVTPGALFYQAVTCQKLWSEQIRSMIAFARGTPPERVLDLVCGAGASAFELARKLDGATITGVDVSPVMLRAARNARDSKFQDVADQITFVEADARALPFEDASFDLVTGHSFLYLVDDPEAVLREVRRVLAPGGRLVLMEPATEGGLLQTLPYTGTMLGMFVRSPLTAFRFAFAIVHWRMLAVAVVSTLSQPTIETWLGDAGYPSVRLEPTIGGLGWHVRAEV
jgi:ubiquinone/menaquinone biosynthesis C-methylase UbiE